MPILGDCIKTYQIAGHQLEVFEGKYVRAVGILFSGSFEQTDVTIRASIHGVMKANIVKPKLISCLNADRYLFNRTGAVVASWTADGNCRRRRLVRSNKVIL